MPVFVATKRTYRPLQPKSEPQVAAEFALNSVLVMSAPCSYENRDFGPYTISVSVLPTSRNDQYSEPKVAGAPPSYSKLTVA